MDFRQIDRDLQAEFATKKMTAEKISAQNLARAKSNLKFIKLDSLERELVLEISKCKSKTKSFDNLKQNLKTVREEKTKVLKSLNLSADDLKPKYECKICGDAGFVNGRQCECFKKRKNEELIKLFGLTAKENCTFETFNVEICKNAKQAEILQKTAKFLKIWSEKFPNNEQYNIIISGGTGVGKTFLTSCLANEMLKKDKTVCFISAFDLNEAFLKYHTSFDATKSSWLTPFIEADILFIDDLGTEPILKNITKNYLYLVLSERECFSRPVVITTNLLLNELSNRYDERICSRLFNKRTSKLIHIEGSDLRLSK